MKEKNARVYLKKSKGSFYNLCVEIEGTSKDIDLVVSPLARDKIAKAKVYRLLSHQLPKED